MIQWYSVYCIVWLTLQIKYLWPYKDVRIADCRELNFHLQAPPDIGRWFCFNLRPYFFHSLATFATSVLSLKWANLSCRVLMEFGVEYYLLSGFSALLPWNPYLGCWRRRSSVDRALNILYVLPTNILEFNKKKKFQMSDVCWVESRYGFLFSLNTINNKECQGINISLILRFFLTLFLDSSD